MQKTDTNILNLFADIDKKLETLENEENLLISKKRIIVKNEQKISDYGKILTIISLNPTMKITSEKSKLILNESMLSYPTFKNFIVSSIENERNKLQDEINKLDGGS